MKKIQLLLALGLILGSTNVNGQTLKEKMQAKLDKANEKMAAAAKGKKKYKQYDYTDESGISGTYFTIEDIIDKQGTIGFQFTKEKEGEIVNKLYVNLGGKGYGDRTNSITCTLKEKYKKNFGINYFYITDKDVPGLANNHNSFVFMEIATNVYAFAEEGKVLTVAAKDSSNFGDYDTETAQVLFDQNMGKINAEAQEKETAKWMKNALYAKNVNKIVFAPEDWHLMKRGEPNHPPKVDGKAYTSKLDMAGNMNYMAFFKVPPATKYPGQDINIVYEMGGKTTNRVEQRKESAAWGKMIPRIESSKFDDRQHAPRGLRTYNTYYGQWVQDYAFIKLLYMNKDKFMIGKTYDLTVKMHANRDGENGDLIAEGVVSLLYSAEAHLAFNGDPDHPEKKSVWDHYEEFLEE